MSGARRARGILSGVLALAVVAGVVYGAAALLSPLPRLHIDQRLVAPTASWSDEVVLPESGSTAVLAESGSIVSAGSAEARPIAGAAKLVLALVALDAEPLAAGQTGAAITIDQDALNRYRELDGAGARTVAVLFGQTWTRRDLIAATVLGSGNNIAELLIDEVFGGLDGYLSAAQNWLEREGFTDTTIVDGTGLDGGSRSTAVELAQIARLALENPVLGSLLDERPRSTSAGVAYTDESSFLTGLGTVGFSRSYTDPAGVCVLLSIDAGDETIVVVLLGQPSYPSAEAATTAAIESARAAVREVEVVAEGQVVAEARSAWGQSTEYIATESVWVSSTEIDGLGVRIEAASRSTIIRGADAGSLVVSADGDDQIIRLESTSAISEPGVAWRFADPVTVIQRWTG